MSQSHFCDDGQHDLLSLGWVRVLAVFVEPRFERVGVLSGRILPPRRCAEIYTAVTEKKSFQRVNMCRKTTTKDDHLGEHDQVLCFIWR